MTYSQNIEYNMKGGGHTKKTEVVNGKALSFALGGDTILF